MNKYQKIYMAAMVAAIPSWFVILEHFGRPFQVGGLVVQGAGIAVIVWLLAAKRPKW